MSAVGTSKARRVAFVNTHPIQYLAPLYASLNQADDVDVTALYLSDFSIRGAEDRAFGRAVQWDIDLLAGYDARFVEGYQQRAEPKGFLSMLASALWREIGDGGFDAVVVHGHTPAAMLLAITAAKAHGVPVFMRAETHLGLQRSRLKSALRAPLMGALYRSLNGVLAIGSANRDFYRAMGVRAENIFETPYTVDNDRFSAGAKLTDRPAERLRLGVADERPIILFTGKLVAGKRAVDLVRAAAKLAAEGLAFHVVIVGSGALEADLRREAATLGLSNVHFPGFVNQQALPRVYGASDIFAFPSESETWGLSVNEAMCAGLPIVAAREIGCTADLVLADRNGATFPARDVDALAAALRPLIASPALRMKMGRQSQEIISNWSYRECLDGLRAALASTRRTPAG